jgi:peptide/nickel transport system permease protein
MYVQYFMWVWNIVTRGDFGRSFQWNKPVKDLIWERMAITTAVALTALVFTFVVAIPIGIYSALNKYTFGDFTFTVLGYIGLATPPFLFALILMFIGYKYFGASVGGLFSPEYMEAPWSLGKILDMMSHLWIPVIVLGMTGTAGLIRIMRGMLLDELQKQYVVTARAKGVQERVLIFKYPVRIALNPIMSTIGWRLTMIISGAPIVAVVLSLPTTGPLLLRSLLSQDMYLAGAFFLLLCILTVIGTFISDLLLAAMDPRIRMGG